MSELCEGPIEIEKIMSIRRDEFEIGLALLAGAPVPPHAIESTSLVYLIPADGAPAPVRCIFEPLPETVLGGLLRLPRARVTLDLSSLSGDARERFLLAFDRNFQRGGG